jgi:transposase
MFLTRSNDFGRFYRAGRLKSSLQIQNLFLKNYTSRWFCHGHRFGHVNSYGTAQNNTFRRFARISGRNCHGGKLTSDKQKRYVGLDVHKHYVMVGAVNRLQEMVLPPRKVSLVEFEGWARKHLRPTDEVVLEATTNAWYLYDLLEPLVERVVVCHPPQVKLIAAALVKTDKKDTMTLAKLLSVNMIPPVWAPPQEVRETPYLLQLPGIGLLTAMTILSAIGDIRRFPSAKKLVGYAGLGAKIHSSGQTHRTGGITKQGRKELRAVLVEAAWIAIRYNQPWREQFEALAFRIGREKAIVAIARKLLVIIWHVLTAKAADRRAVPQQVARYFITWGRQLRVKSTMGLKASEFARQQLDRLELGRELERVPYGSVTYCLPPATTTT